MALVGMGKVPGRNKIGCFEDNDIKQKGKESNSVQGNVFLMKSGGPCDFANDFPIR